MTTKDSPIYDGPPIDWGMVQAVTGQTPESCCDGGRCTSPVQSPATSQQVEVIRIESDTKPDRGHPEFRRILDELWALHQRKGADYGTQADRLANIRSAEECGVEPWRYALVRANEKMNRLKTFSMFGMLENESVEDSFADLASQAILALLLYREAEAAPVAVSDR